MSTNQPPETLMVSTTKLSCDGGDGPLGHPRVYLTMTKDGQVDCPYCGRRYVLTADKNQAAEHH